MSPGGRPRPVCGSRRTARGPPPISPLSQGQYRGRDVRENRKADRPPEAVTEGGCEARGPPGDAGHTLERGAATRRGSARGKGKLVLEDDGQQRGTQGTAGSLDRVQRGSCAWNLG